MSDTLVVDLHQHVIPGFYWDASNEDGNVAGGITPPRWSLEGAIAYLDEAGIDVALPSISTPGVHFGDDAAARRLARRVNEYLTEIRRDRPDRFGTFASLPLPDIEGSLEQIEYAVDTSRAVAKFHYGNTFARTPDVKYLFAHAGAISIGGLRQLQSTRELDDGERRSVLGESAAALIPRLRPALT
jgi:predicted TIM-barrel fold metal-dependent hydrolase